MHRNINVRRRAGGARCAEGDGSGQRQARAERCIVHHLGAVFISETRQDDHEKKVKYLKEAGYSLLADKAVGLSGTDEYCAMPPQLWFDTAVAMRRDDADAYFISCANIRSIDVIQRLEATLGKPVVTSNQAAFWRALRMAGVDDNVPGLGSLMIHKAPVDLVDAA